MSEFLAEAQVLIRPNTSTFRAKLLLDLREIQASVPAVRIPVIAAGGAAAASGVAAANREVAAASAAASTAVNKQTVSERALSAAQVSATANASNLARAQLLNERATRALAAGETRALLTTSPLAAARARLAAANIAANTQERALAAALASGNAAAIAAITESETLARVRQAQAVTTVEAAIAEQKLAASQVQAASRTAFVRRGVLATGAEMAGLRGATLAANSAFIAGAAGAILFVKAIQGAAGLEQELSVFKVTAQATADEMQRVSEEATRLGADISLPGVSSRDAAESMTELSKAGLDVRDSIGGARGVLQLAAAAQISNAEATELAASALNSFGLSGVEAVHVADLLANAANNAQGSISDMGLALRQAAAVSRQVGFSIEDTTAILTLLAKNGLQGSDAGTALRTSLIRLINPSKEASAAIEKLGLNLRDAQGNLRPEVFAEFAEATANLSRSQADATAALVFGQDAIRAQAILGREGAAGLDAMREAMDRQGAAAELAGARAQGFSGQLSALGSNLETLGTSLGTAILPPLTAFVGQLNLLVTDASAAASAIAKLSVGIGDLNKELRRSIPLLGRLEDSFTGNFAEGFVNALNPAIPAIRLIGRTFGESSDEIQTDTRAIANSVKAVVASIEGPISSTKLNAAVVSLQDMADKLAAGDANARGASRELKALIAEIQTLDALPASVIEITARLDRAGLKTEAQEGGNIVLDSMKSILSPEAGRGMMFDFMEGAKAGVAASAPEVGSLAGQAIVQGLDVQISVAEAQGAGDQRILAILREQERKQAAFLERMLARPQTKEVQVLVKKAADNLAATRAKIQSILDGQVADADRAKNNIIAATRDAEQAGRDADQALLGAFDPAQTKARNAILAAASTEQLSDDIKGQLALRAIITKQIAVGRDKIKDRKTLAAFLEAQNKELFQINLTIADLRDRAVVAGVSKRVSAAESRVENAELTAGLGDDIRAQVNLRKTVTAAIAKLQAEGGNTLAAIKDFIAKRKAIKQKIADLRQEQRAERLEGLGLNVEFAEITGNRSAEVKAREAEIKAIREQMNHEKKTSNEYKRLRNELAAKQKELAELKKQKDKTANAFNELTFSFLQTQQGFAANLLGNLIPGSATAGLVGASPPSPPPGADLGPLAGAKAARDQGVTPGSFSQLIGIQKAMLDVMERIAAGNTHPETKYQRVSSGASMDFQGGV